MYIREGEIVPLGASIIECSNNREVFAIHWKTLFDNDWMLLLGWKYIEFRLWPKDYDFFNNRNIEKAKRIILWQ